MHHTSIFKLGSNVFKRHRYLKKVLSGYTPGVKGSVAGVLSWKQFAWSPRLPSLDVLVAAEGANLGWP